MNFQQFLDADRSGPVVALVLISSGLSIGVLSSCRPNASACNQGERETADGRCVRVIDAGNLGDTDGTRPDRGDGSDRWKDPDDDGIPNAIDNCPRHPNENQNDPDGDHRGTPCDNCPQTANVDQKDSNDDGQGNLCSGDETYDRDRDRDGDGHPDLRDNCPETGNSAQSDPDGDNIGSACDNCPDTANVHQEDSDDDDRGDACEPKPAGTICKRKSGNFQRVVPNIYFLIDRSSSMTKTTSTGNSRMVDAKKGLDQIAQSLASEFRVGMASFPCAPSNTQCGHLLREFLAVGRYSTQTIIDSYRSNYNQQLCPGKSAKGGPTSGLDVEYPGLHCTETGSAMRYLHKNQLYLDQSDPLSAVREKAVVLITDGCACDGGGGGTNKNCHGQTQQSLAEMWAKKMANNGIPVYVVGFDVARCFPNKTNDPASKYLNPIAMKGGTDAGTPGGKRFYTPKTPSQLASALTSISRKVPSCEYKLSSPKNISENKIWVNVGGTFLSDSEFTYDSSNRTLQLSKSACKSLKNAGSQSLEIVLGCPTQCEDSEESCDFADNDCDGEVDETCTDCSSEVCNGRDDDCDGESDEGCPSCAAVGESCDGSTPCCSGDCTDGSCSLCRPTGVSCRQDDQCCTGSCSSTGDGNDTCTVP